mgnify:CR=1 FL=1
MSKLPCILLVDDDPITNFLNRKLLERLAVAEQILVAPNGREALDVLLAQCGQQHAGPPVLVLLDVNMPVMNGFQFLEAYQQLPPAQQCALVVVMLTTSVSPRDQQRIHELPVAAYLSKPLTQQQVEQVVQQHFS